MADSGLSACFLPACQSVCKPLVCTSACTSVSKSFRQLVSVLPMPFCPKISGPRSCLSANILSSCQSDRKCPVRMPVCLQIAACACVSVCEHDSCLFVVMHFCPHAGPSAGFYVCVPVFLPVLAYFCLPACMSVLKFSSPLNNDKQ